jgi:Pentapeptide repeats (8 copies)
MANEEHVAQLLKGAPSWNAWRGENRGIGPDLSKADLRGADLSRADLSGASLIGAKLSGASLREATLSDADLSETQLGLALFISADLSGAKLKKANLLGANLAGANLAGANLQKANLRFANLTRTNFTDADLTGCSIYGVSAWGLKLKGAKQQNLVITRGHEPEITVDNIEVAQFIYLMLKNQKVREVIDTITSKAVLILGRFTAERKVVLDALREELRKRNYLPILFDFEVPATRDITETVSLLARMARSSLPT